MKLGENYYGKDGINAYYRYPDVEVKMNYLQIPVKLGYNFHINDKLSLIPNVGLYAAYGFNAGESDLQMVGDGKLIHAGWKPWMAMGILPIRLFGGSTIGMSERQLVSRQ